MVFLGLPADEESEGYDRDHMNLPAAQLALLDAVLTANPNVVVVLSNGGAVALPFRDRVPAIVEGWLLGQAGGGATAARARSAQPAEATPTVRARSVST